MKTQKYSHIPEIQLYNEIKQFYRMFQTEETDERLDKLEEVTRLIEEKIQDDVGMDVLGHEYGPLPRRARTSILSFISAAIPKAWST